MSTVFVDIFYFVDTFLGCVDSPDMFQKGNFTIFLKRTDEQFPAHFPSIVL